ncbi:MAG: HypC/HybG/HupF family hydrogenase formation chaperone [Proteobacteria bacterium]|nr:HypC/HybG/HupF family hydrogenase formation chaperone [Pseudomonadota bacterium]MBU1708700.1 HypC/HybG/HupF family hydrogenase formation chaperone [Pseudomonadota bacterium]
MCLAVPGKLVEIYEEAGLKMGRIDYSGTFNMACLEYVPEIEVGQYTVVHAGFAISAIDEDEARKTLEIWQELIKATKEQGIDIFAVTSEE